MSDHCPEHAGYYVGCTACYKVREARWRSELSPAQCSAAGLAARITEYLELGGLFNPELMDHDKVRDLLIACREYFNQQQNTVLGNTSADK